MDQLRKRSLRKNYNLMLNPFKSDKNGEEIKGNLLTSLGLHSKSPATPKLEINVKNMSKNKKLVKPGNIKSVSPNSSKTLNLKSSNVLKLSSEPTNSGFKDFRETNDKLLGNSLQPYVALEKCSDDIASSICLNDVKKSKSVSFNGVFKISPSKTIKFYDIESVTSNSEVIQKADWYATKQNFVNVSADDNSLAENSNNVAAREVNQESNNLVNLTSQECQRFLSLKLFKSEKNPAIVPPNTSYKLPLPSYVNRTVAANFSEHLVNEMTSRQPEIEIVPNQVSNETKKESRNLDENEKSKMIVEEEAEVGNSDKLVLKFVDIETIFKKPDTVIKPRKTSTVNNDATTPKTGKEAKLKKEGKEVQPKKAGKEAKEKKAFQESKPKKTGKEASKKVNKEATPKKVHKTTPKQDKKEATPKKVNKRTPKTVKKEETSKKVNKATPKSGNKEGISEVDGEVSPERNLEALKEVNEEVSKETSENNVNKTTSKRLSKETKSKKLCKEPKPKKTEKKTSKVNKEKPLKQVNTKMISDDPVNKTQESEMDLFDLEVQSPDTEDESDVDMPLISLTPPPEARKSEKVKIKIEKDVTKEDKGKRGRKRAMSEPKKRGRKKIKRDEDSADESKGDVISDVDEDDLEHDTLVSKVRKKSQRRTGRRFSVTGNWYIASGYLNDIISLLEEFDSIKSWRFKDFATCWKDKAFSLVYRGRQTFKELLEFSEEIALLTKRFLGPPHSTKRRIGALYTLYGLYYKFPLGKLQFFNLRFELKEYKELLALIYPFRSNLENPDPAFIFRKLELDGAILHCATAYEPCYDFHNEERDYVELEYGKERLAKSSAVTNAIPKIQLQADLDLLQHYHSVKAKIAGEEIPERALVMITPEFLFGISTNLAHLRKETLLELGMGEEQANYMKLKESGEEGRGYDSDSLSASPEDPLEVNTEIGLYSIGQNMIDTVNNGVTGQKSQKALKNNQIATDQAVREFMQPPSAEELKRPLKLQNKLLKETKDKKVTAGYSMDWKENLLEKVHPCKKLNPNNDKGQLDINTDHPEYEDLTEILLPQPLPPKKKRSRRRPQTLLQEASFPSRRSKKSQGFPIVKTLTDSSNTSMSFHTANYSVALPDQSATATRMLVSELPEIVPAKPVDDTIVIKVRMKADGIRKIVKLKVKVSTDQFRDIQKNPERYENFISKLKPLIKATQKGEHKDMDWNIEDILLHDEQENAKQIFSPVSRKNVSTSPVRPSSPARVVPFKMRYECLKYSDDEHDEENMEEEDEDLFPCKWKTEEEKDGDYAPPDEIEEEEEPLEFEDEGIDEEDDDFRQSSHSWHKKRWRSYSQPYEVERGPLDSDQLLLPRNEKSISMVPMRVGGSVKYFPMINTNTQESKEKETTFENGLDNDLITDPRDVDSIFTWNDFSSDKSPPFKKKGNSKSFSYIFSPKPLVSNTEKRPLRKIASSTTIKTKPIVKPPPPPRKSSRRGRKRKSENLETSIKKEMTVLEELADDWEDDTSVVGSQETFVSEKHEIDPLGVENTLAEETPHELLVEDNEVYCVDDTDIVDATDFHAELDEPCNQSKYSDEITPNFNHVEDLLHPNFNGSYMEEVEGTQPITQILPDISLPINNSYENETFLNNLVNEVPLSMPSQSVLPGTLLMSDRSATGTQKTGENSFAQDVLNINQNTHFKQEQPQQQLYYKMTTTDGNNVFIPLSSYSQIPTKDIDILTFDVADVKPMLPITSTESSNNPEYNSFPSTNTNNDLHYTSTSISSHVQDKVISPTSYHYDYTSQSANQPTTSVSPAVSFPATPTSSSSTSNPVCTFFFSPKLKALNKLPFAQGIASGRVPVSKPKVKFLMKGLFKSRSSL